MFKAYASYLLHLTPRTQHLLPRLNFQFTQAVFRAALTKSGDLAAPVSAVIGEHRFNIFVRRREDGTVFIVVDYLPINSSALQLHSRGCA